MAVTSVNSGTASVALASTAVRRASLSIRNTDANILYVLVGSGTASATNHTVALASGDYWEMPAAENYTGPVNGVWAADGAGVALVTEY